MKHINDKGHYFCIRAKGKIYAEIWYKIKINEFNLEKTKTKTRTLHAYQDLYSLVCFVGLWLSIIGIDYSKNYNHLKNKLTIRFTKRNTNKKS